MEVHRHSLLGGGLCCGGTSLFSRAQSLLRVNLKFNLRCYRLFRRVDLCFDLQIFLNLLVTGLLEIAHV